MGKKIKTEDTHKYGKNCGYDLLPNGRIVVAPLYKDEFEVLRNEELAVKMLLDSMTNSCHTIMKSITARQQNWWKKVKDDYGLNDHLSYNPNNGIITIGTDKEEGEIK